MLHEKENLIKSSCRWLILFCFFLLLCWQVPRSRFSLHTHSGIFDNCLVPRSICTVWEPDQANACMAALVVQLPCPLLRHSPTLPGPLPLSSHPPPLLPYTHSYIPCCLLCCLWLVGCCLGRAILLQDVWGKERFQAVHGDLPELLLKLLISAPKEYIT